MKMTEDKLKDDLQNLQGKHEDLKFDLQKAK